MQFKVPQDVQREDTIIGNITIKQMIILIVGGGITYMIYVGMTKRGFEMIFWLPPVGIVGLITLAIAFLKISNIPFTKYILLLIERMVNPQIRMWKMGAGEVYEGIFANKSALEKKGNTKKEKEDKTIEEKQQTLTHISRLSQILDTRGSQNDVQHAQIDIAKDEDLLHEAYQTGIKSEKHKERLTKLTITPQVKEPVTETPSMVQPESAPESIIAHNPKSGEINLSQSGGTISLT